MPKLPFTVGRLAGLDMVLRPEGGVVEVHCEGRTWRQELCPECSLDFVDRMTHLAPPHCVGFTVVKMENRNGQETP